MKKIELDIRLKESPGKKQLFALVDDEDYEYLNQFNWVSKLQKRKCLDPIYYVHQKGKGK